MSTKVHYIKNWIFACFYRKDAFTKTVAPELLRSLPLYIVAFSAYLTSSTFYIVGQLQTSNPLAFNTDAIMVAILIGFNMAICVILYKNCCSSTRVLDKFQSAL